MKKLMCAVAALAAGVALADITSSNIVGYQSKTSVAGFNFVTPTFKNVSGGNVSIQDIKLSGENVIEYVDAIGILDEGGSPTQTYFWTADGWVDDDSKLVTVSLAPGEGVLINTLQEKVNIQFAGEVNSDDMKLMSVAGFNFVGNASPVNIDIQAITLSGDNVIEYVDAIGILDEGGSPTQTYFWTSAGWVNDDSATVKVNLTPGDGVLINTLQAGVEINLPAAEF